MLNKKNIIGVAAGIAALVLTGSAFATAPGAYVGGQLGLGDTHIDFPTSAGTSSRDTGIAGRVFGGYQINNYVGAELGYTKFSNATGKINSTDINGNAFTVKDQIKSQAVDLVAKGTLPLENGFSVYGKLGAAYLMNDADISSTGVAGLINPLNGGSFGGFSQKTSQDKLLPTFGVGAAYDINANLTTDLSWNRIQKVGSDINSTDLYSVGLIYSFG